MSPHKVETSSPRNDRLHQEHLARVGSAKDDLENKVANEASDWLTGMLAPVVRAVTGDPHSMFHETLKRVTGRSFSKTAKAPPRHVKRSGEVRDGYHMPLWYDDLVPAPFASGATARCMLSTGSCIRGQLLRLPNCSGTGGGEATDTNLVPDLKEPFEVEHREAWRSEAAVLKASTACRTITLIGTGIVGALDGAISSPFLAYPQFSWRQIPQPMMAFARLMRGNIAIEGRHIEDPDTAAWWRAYAASVRVHTVSLFVLRENDREAYRSTLSDMLVAALMSWGECGWLYHELEAGDVKQGTDVVAVNRLEALADRAITLYVGDYLAEFGRG